MPGKDIIVAGGGIVGICSALALQQDGHRVTLIDRAAPGQGTSLGNAGVISPWSIVPQAMPGIWKSIPGMVLRRHGPARVPLRHAPGYLPWLWRFLRESRPGRAQANSDAMSVLCGESVELYRGLLAGTGHEGLIVDSFYVHAVRRASGADLSALGQQMRRARGAPLELIGADALRRLEPALSPDFTAAIVIGGQARARDPGRIGAVLAEKFAGAGGILRHQTIRALERGESGWRVVTDTGVEKAQKVVLAAGAWSPGLLAPLGITVPLAAERGYHLNFPGTGLCLNNSILDVEQHAVASTMERGLRVAGMAEFAGPDTPASPHRIEAMRRTAIAMFPDLAGQPFEPWMGVRPSFPDSLPMLGEIPGQPGLIAAFGHSHYGLMMAPKSGRIVAALVSGLRSNLDLAPYAPGRFA